MHAHDLDESSAPFCGAAARGTEQLCNLFERSGRMGEGKSIGVWEHIDEPC